MKSPLFIHRLELTNYKSIEKCALDLRPLMFLVGRNGSGKSNLLDALRFVAESLTTSLSHAVEERGGIHEVRRRSSGQPKNFIIKFDFHLDDTTDGEFSVEISSEGDDGYQVVEEKCVLFKSGDSQERSFYRVVDGQVYTNLATAMPAALKDRLYLVNASGLPEFRSVYEALSRMTIYNINPQVIRDLQSPDPGDVLKRDGGNIASIMERLEKEDPQAYANIKEYLKKIVPGIIAVESFKLGHLKTLRFLQEVQDAKHPWSFNASSMSDGTLRAIGVLTALFQSSRNPRSSIRLVGIEEPEVALHPGAAGLLLDGLRQASESRQVIVTSHSPDLLDNPDIDEDSILSVESIKGTTIINPLGAITRKTLRDKLYTPGELLRLDQLRAEEFNSEAWGEPVQ